MYVFILLLFVVQSNGLLTSAPHWDQTPHIQTFPITWTAAACTSVPTSYPYLLTTTTFNINRTFDAASLLKGFVGVTSYSPYSSTSYYYYHYLYVSVVLSITQVTITVDFEYCVNYAYFQVMMYTA